jgi:hypothetical protein
MAAMSSGRCGGVEDGVLNSARIEAAMMTG